MTCNKPFTFSLWWQHNETDEASSLVKTCPLRWTLVGTPNIQQPVYISEFLCVSVGKNCSSNTTGTTACETHTVAIKVHYGVLQSALQMRAACVCCCVVCTSVSRWAQGTVHAPGLSVQTAALCVCGLPVETQRLGACQVFCKQPADPLVVYLLCLMLLYKHTLRYYIHIHCVL